MHRWSVKSFGTALSAAAVLLTCQGASSAPAPHASSAHTRGAAAQKQAHPLDAQSFMLHLHHLHTGESLNIVYKIGDKYLPQAIAKLNYFLRDHRTNSVSHYDPKEFDLLHSVMNRLGRPNGTIDVVCGYRTPQSNEYLRTRTADTGVAKQSQHMQAKAIDIRVPGVRTNRLRDAALSLKGGGVGYYPVSQFVHVDVGPVRQWSYFGVGE